MPKWVHNASSLAVVLFGSLAAFDWSSMISANTAAKIVLGLGVAKTLANSVAGATPSSSS
jgi:hypothetical protein